MLIIDVQYNFITSKAGLMPGYQGAIIRADNFVELKGLDRDQCLDIDCKLLNFQFSNRLDTRSHLKIYIEEAE